MTKHGIPVVGVGAGQQSQCPITGNSEVPKRELGCYLRHLASTYLWHLLPAWIQSNIRRAVDLIARVCRRISERENWEPSPYYKG
jgi:hypothetical protein